KLKYLDDYAERRRKVADYYDAAFRDLKNIQIPVRAPYSTHVFHQYTVKLKNVDRDEVRKKLAEQGIPSMVYYPIPLHLQNAYRDNRNKEGVFKNTEELSRSVLSLPIHTEFEEKDLKFISDTI